MMPTGDTRPFDWIIAIVVISGLAVAGLIVWLVLQSKKGKHSKRNRLVGGGTALGGPFSLCGEAGKLPASGFPAAAAAASNASLQKSARAGAR